MYRRLNVNLTQHCRIIMYKKTKWGRVSAIELQLQDGVEIRQAQADIQKILGNGFTVKDRYEQQEDVFRIMEVEKLIAYLFLTFILLVADRKSVV